RNCWSMWRGGVGDSPAKTPGTNGAGAGCTPIALVVKAHADKMQGGGVVTADSVDEFLVVLGVGAHKKRSAGGGAECREHNDVPRMAKVTERTSTVPDDASPNDIAMMIQPLESSRIADATMIWPISRRMKFISRTTMATILIEEIESAVARKSEETKRACG